VKEERKADSTMATIFAQFKQAQIEGSGAALAATLSPETSGNPNRLRAFYYLANSADIATEVRYGLLQDRVTGVKLPKQEGNAWVDVFTAFGKAAREIVKLEESPRKGSWTDLFNAWKDVGNSLLRGYSSAGFQAWTLPCLYVAGKYLRIFAMKADAESAKGGPATFSDSYQDDIVSDVNPRAKLEESSWLLNRMYTTCLHDRCGSTYLFLSVEITFLRLAVSRSPIEESRRWGVYATVNLSFKTYFKVLLPREKSERRFTNGWFRSSVNRRLVKVCCMPWKHRMRNSLL
jgi:hypothetical protein